MHYRIYCWRYKETNISLRVTLEHDLAPDSFHHLFLDSCCSIFRVLCSLFSSFFKMQRFFHFLLFLLVIFLSVLIFTAPDYPLSLLKKISVLLAELKIVRFNGKLLKMKHWYLVLLEVPGQYPHLKAQFALAHCAFLPTHCSTL